jgi:hypothetical protein
MSDNIKVNWIEITKTDVIINQQISNKQKLGDVELSQLIQNFSKINIREIDPIALSNERKKLLFEEGFNRIVDEVNNLIFKLINKGVEKKFEKQVVIEYLNNNINLQEIYDWLLCNHQISTNSIFIFAYFNFYGIVANVNYEKAFNLFIDASKKGHILAQLFVGRCYKRGYGTKKDEDLAFIYYERVADKNYAIGQLEIGYCYGNEIGTEQSSEDAFYWYEIAANNGNIIAMYNLGTYYEDGIGVEKDDNKAFEMFKQSADGGYPGGIMMLGYCYDEGIGTKIDKKKAFELYQNAANLGHNIAQNKSCCNVRKRRWNYKRHR